MDSQLNSIFETASQAKKVPGFGAIALDKSGHVLFKGTYGSTNLDDPAAPALTSKTPIVLWSCTKLATTTAALQLLEQGKLRLDDLVEKYVPSIAKIPVLEGFDPPDNKINNNNNGGGEPILRPQRTKATVLMLMTHTAGFTYDFFNKDTFQWRNHAGQNQSEYMTVSSMATYETPLAFDPGTRYEYGVNTDWLGFVVEAVSGMPLDKYIDEHILQPLGMQDSGSHVKHAAAAAAPLRIHMRGEDGGLTAAPPIEMPPSPERVGGGHYMISTLDDYSTLLLAILNSGTHPVSRAQILKKETVEEYLFKDHLHHICSNSGVGVIKTANAVLSSEGDFLPGLEKGWSTGLMLNFQESPNGRNAWSGQWAGLGNLYYWMDPQGGKLGLIMSGILPFMDKEVLRLFDELERAVYGHGESATDSVENGETFSVVPLPWHMR